QFRDLCWRILCDRGQFAQIAQNELCEKHLSKGVWMNELTQTSPTEIFLKTSTMADIKLQAQRASEMVGAVRAKMLAPSAMKNSPVFIQKEVAERCGLEPGQFSYRMKNTDLPPLPQGNFDPKSRRREFSLAETRTWVKEFRRRLFGSKLPWGRGGRSVFFMRK